MSSSQQVVSEAGGRPSADAGTAGTGGTGGTGIGFQPHLHAQAVPGEGVYLVSEQGVSAVRGDGVAALAPLLDGTRDLAGLIAAADLPPAQVLRLVSRLTEAGLVGPRIADADRGGEAGYWTLAGIDPGAAARLVAAGQVTVRTVGGADPHLLLTALEQAGVQVDHGGCEEDEPPATGLTVVDCHDYLDPALRRLDAAHRAAGTPWLLARTESAAPSVGPFFRPDSGPCWTCMEYWVRRNRQPETYVQQAAGLDDPVHVPAASLAPGRAMGAHVAALETVKWLAGHRYPGQQAIWRLESLSLTGRHHPVRRRPQCRDCGDPGLVAAAVRHPVRLGRRTKASTSGGGDRALTPRQVMDAYGHLVDPVTGLMKEIRRDSRGPDFLNCFHAGHNPVDRPSALSAVRAGLRSRSSGKGTTELDARVSALCEAVERQSGFFQGDEPRRRARYREVARDAVHPNSVQLFHPRQFADREGWNVSHGMSHRVCERLGDDDPIDWTPVWSVTAGCHRLVPTALLYYNVPATSGTRFCSANSNGTAAGSSLEDAVLQGFLELVERDGTALWWYNRTRRPGVDLDALGDAWCQDVRAGHADLGREVWALDLSTDLGVPVVVALSRRVDKPAQDIVLGFGAHFDARTALRRALTELNQMMPPVTAVQPDGSGYGCDDPAVIQWWRTATLENLPYLSPDPVRQPRTSPGRSPHGDLRADLDEVEHLVEKAGMELLVLDQTRPDLGLPVVRVLVPGLRPAWARFAEGRLYDAPVRMGDRGEPVRYDDLNPCPLFM